jgi:hypothetical protein
LRDFAVGRASIGLLSPAFRQIAMWCMRWQRLPVSQGNGATAASMRAGRRLTTPFIVASGIVAVAALLFASTPAPAEGEKVIEGGVTTDATHEDETSGMPASNPRVKAMLAAHPNEFVTICVAGCAGKPSIVQVLPKPLEARSAAMRTTAGDSRPSYGAYGVDADAVTCIAGCSGQRGQAVQRLPGLPPVKVAPVAPAEGNEPLDVVR